MKKGVKNVTIEYRGRDLSISDALAKEYEAALGEPVSELALDCYVRATYVWKCKSDPFGYADSLPEGDVSAAVEKAMQMEVKMYGEER